MHYIRKMCNAAAHEEKGTKDEVLNVQADDQFTAKKQDIEACRCLALLDGMLPQLWAIRDNAIAKIQQFKNLGGNGGGEVAPAPKNIKSYQRQAIFMGKTLTSPAEIDEYVEDIRKILIDLLSGCDGIRIN